LNRPNTIVDGGGRAIGPAASLFDQFEKAIDRRDFAQARKLQRELRRSGYSVVHIGRRDTGRNSKP
jgi:hypothetical protein